MRLIVPTRTHDASTLVDQQSTTHIFIICRKPLATSRSNFLLPFYTHFHFFLPEPLLNLFPLKLKLLKLKPNFPNLKMSFLYFLYLQLFLPLQCIWLTTLFLNGAFFGEFLFKCFWIFCKLKRNCLDMASHSMIHIYTVFTLKVATQPATRSINVKTCFEGSRIVWHCGIPRFLR